MVAVAHTHARTHTQTETHRNTQTHMHIHTHRQKHTDTHAHVHMCAYAVSVCKAAESVHTDRRSKLCAPITSVSSYLSLPLVTLTEAVCVTDGTVGEWCVVLVGLCVCPFCRHARWL